MPNFSRHFFYGFFFEKDHIQSHFPACHRRRNLLVRSLFAAIAHHGGMFPHFAHKHTDGEIWWILAILIKTKNSFFFSHFWFPRTISPVFYIAIFFAWNKTIKMHWMIATGFNYLKSVIFDMKLKFPPRFDWNLIEWLATKMEIH